MPQPLPQQHHPVPGQQQAQVPQAVPFPTRPAACGAVQISLTPTRGPMPCLLQWCSPLGLLLLLLLLLVL